MVFLASQNTPERPWAPVCSEIDTKDQLVWGPTGPSSKPGLIGPLATSTTITQRANMKATTPTLETSSVLLDLRAAPSQHRI